MKKALPVIMAALMAASLAGCGGGSTPTTAAPTTAAQTTAAPAPETTKAETKAEETTAAPAEAKAEPITHRAHRADEHRVLSRLLVGLNLRNHLLRHRPEHLSVIRHADERELGRFQQLLLVVLIICVTQSFSSLYAKRESASLSGGNLRGHSLHLVLARYFPASIMLSSMT